MVDQRDWAWVDQGVAQFRLFLVGGGAGCEPLVERSAKTPPQGSSWKDAPSRLLVPAKVPVVQFVTLQVCADCLHLHSYSATGLAGESRDGRGRLPLDEQARQYLQIRRKRTHSVREIQAARRSPALPMICRAFSPASDSAKTRISAHWRGSTGVVAPGSTACVRSETAGWCVLIFEMGRPSPGRVTAILGQAEPIPTERNRWRYPWQEARLDGDPGSDTYLRYVAVPEGLSSQTPGGGEDPTRMAINRFEAHHMNDSEPGSGFGGLLGLGPVCELPGVLPKCPPARSLRPKLVPIPDGVCVQLTCERDTKGKPVWVFEAMSLIEIADPADEDRKFNLYIEGGE
ncbi:MAG: hypothetical protein KF787_00510 [Phycisphaeraceae bacterium]|nr:hypothetical protein [Phycisphaeraceae bacterium]